MFLKTTYQCLVLLGKCCMPVTKNGASFSLVDQSDEDLYQTCTKPSKKVFAAMFKFIGCSAFGGTIIYKEKLKI